jgi:hypothetical protein
LVAPGRVDAGHRLTLIAATRRKENAPAQIDNACRKTPAGRFMKSANTAPATARGCFRGSNEAQLKPGAGADATFAVTPAKRRHGRGFAVASRFNPNSKSEFKAPGNSAG